MSITSSAATMRVLSVLRHWVTKHGQVRVIYFLFILFLCYSLTLIDIDQHYNSAKIKKKIR